MAKKTNYKVVMTAIIGLVVLECFAMYKGINGTMYAIVLATIAALAGLVIPTPKALRI